MLSVGDIMNDNINYEDMFDGDKLLSQYDTMSLDEVVSFLGEEKAALLNEKIQSGIINLDQISQICKDAYPKYPQRAEWLKNCIYGKLSKTDRLRLEGVEAEQIKMVATMEDYKEKVKNGTLTQSELKELCDITFGKDSEESSIIFDRMSGRVKSDEIREYDEYREQLNARYLKEKDSDTFLTSSFTMVDGEQRKCEHSLQEIKGQERKTIMNKTFDFNESFQKNMLEPAIVDFAERNPIISSDTRQNTENINTSNYRAISETNNVLNVNNVTPEYANTVSSAVNQVPPTVYQQQVMPQQQMGTGMTMGFANILLIFSLIGMLVGILFVIGLYVF